MLVDAAPGSPLAVLHCHPSVNRSANFSCLASKSKNVGLVWSVSKPLMEFVFLLCLPFPTWIRETGFQTVCWSHTGSFLHQSGVLGLVAAFLFLCPASLSGGYYSSGCYM